MMSKLKIAIALGAATAIAGCSEWRREAGAQVDEGAFGNPTMNNVEVQTSGYVIDLNNRFASEVPTTVNFEFDRASLDSTAQDVLRQQANWIKQFPEAKFSVFGHTDLVGSASYNKSLGLRRANAVVAFLESQGISRDRLEAKVSFGKTQPLVVTNSRERRNRRTVTEVSGFVSNNPAELDGKYAAIIYREYVESATELPTSDESGLGEIAQQGN